MNIIPIEVTLLNNLLEIVKIFKTDIIFLDLDGSVYGFDEDLNYMVESDVKINMPSYLNIPLIIKCLDFKNFMKERENFQSKTFNVEYANQYFLSESQYRIMSMVYLYNKLKDIINRIKLRESYCNNWEEFNNINNDEQFKIMLKAKSSLGTVKLYYGNHILIVTKSLYAINSSDKVNLKIFKFDLDSFVAKFIITKKGITMNQYIRFLDIK